MKLKQQYQELLRLKKEINQRLARGTDFHGIRELMLYLAGDQAYSKLKLKENQLIMLECFLNIWLQEKKKLPDLGIKTDIFYKIFSLEGVEQKYQRIKYCGFRIENEVPDEYIEQALEWLIEDKVSGIAIGKIIVFETEKREENLLYIIRYLRRRGDIVNALMLAQYANETFPGCEKFLLEEAKELMEELQQVAKNDR